MREKAMPMVRLWAIVLLLSAWLPTMSWAGGWYLMVGPEKLSKGENKPDLSWPLKGWRQLESFDSAKVCEARRMRELASLAALLSAAPNEPLDMLTDATEQYLLRGDKSKIPARLIGRIAQALVDYEPRYLCIATDDPRLK